MVYWLAYYRKYKTENGDKLYWRRFTSEMEMEDFITKNSVIPWVCVTKEQVVKMSTL
jgi:hypothetical protein